jgi:cytochrome c biogenesis protein
MAKLRDLYEPVLGPGLVDLFERLGFFNVFRSTIFSIGLAVLLVSIVACTIDRLPRLWRQATDVRVVQPEPYFDPRLPDRATIDGGLTPEAVRAALRRHGYRVREAEVEGVRYLYGDRNQYAKLATIFTHAGLVLFLVAAAVTSRFGDEVGLVVAEGTSTTVQPIGTPDLLLVKNYAFEAPGFETGQPRDFVTDLGVFQNGREIARKQIRVNDPLSVAGYTFHQNGFGPAPELVIADTAGRPLWDGPVPMTDQAAGFPYAQFSVPGRDVGLELLLQRSADGRGIVLVLPYRVVGRNPDGSAVIEELLPMAIAVGETQTVPGLDFTVGLRRVVAYTLVIAKHDPGQGLVWLAFGLLILGIVGTFHFPRRRVWARLRPDGSLALVARADRYVDARRAFGPLVADLARRRVPPEPASG